MAAKRKKSSTAPTGKIELSAEQIEKAEHMLPGVLVRKHALKDEIKRLQTKAKADVKALEKRLKPLEEKEVELSQACKNGYLEESQREMFTEEWPADVEDDEDDAGDSDDEPADLQ